MYYSWYDMTYNEADLHSLCKVRKTVRIHYTNHLRGCDTALRHVFTNMKAAIANTKVGCLVKKRTPKRGQI